MTSDRLAIHAGDPDAVFVEEAKLLAYYSATIAPVVDDIMQEFLDPAAARVAAAAYIAARTRDIPDETIKGAVRTLARKKFQIRGLELNG
jgi:hypothetical protein